MTATRSCTRMTLITLNRRRVPRFVSVRQMATGSPSASHLERTRTDFRQEGSLYDVKISKVDEVNSSIRLIELELALPLPDHGRPFTYLPGQWLDVHIPTVARAGGFTITSAPRRAAERSRYMHVELAIQKAPGNPPAAFLWRPDREILGAGLQIRVGGRFVYPPPELSWEEGRGMGRIVFVVGGVGINPVMSILEHLHVESLLHSREGGVPSLRLLYGARVRVGEAILFHDRIAGILRNYEDRRSGENADYDYSAAMHLTGTPDWTLHGRLKSNNIEYIHGRINPSCVLHALGPGAGRENTVVYVCGPQIMTDEIVETMSSADGMDPRRVLCEKWW